MKKKYFRIIDLQNRQVLLMKDFDEDEKSPYLLKIIFFTEDINATRTFGFSNESKRDNAFNSMTDVYIENIVNNTKQFFE